MSTGGTNHRHAPRGPVLFGARKAASAVSKSVQFHDSLNIEQSSRPRCTLHTQGPRFALSVRARAWPTRSPAAACGTREERKGRGVPDFATRRHAFVEGDRWQKGGSRARIERFYEFVCAEFVCMQVYSPCQRLGNRTGSAAAVGGQWRVRGQGRHDTTKIDERKIVPRVDDSSNDRHRHSHLMRARARGLHETEKANPSGRIESEVRRRWEDGGGYEADDHTTTTKFDSCKVVPCVTDSSNERRRYPHSTSARMRGLPETENAGRSTPIKPEARRQRKDGVGYESKGGTPKKSDSCKFVPRANDS